MKTMFKTYLMVSLLLTAGLIFGFFVLAAL